MAERLRCQEREGDSCTGFGGFECVPLYGLPGGKVNFRWRVRPLPTVSADVGHSVDVGLVDLGIRRVCEADDFLIRSSTS